MSQLSLSMTLEHVTSAIYTLQWREYEIILLFFYLADCVLTDQLPPDNVLFTSNEADRGMEKRASFLSESAITNECIGKGKPTNWHIEMLRIVKQFI